MVQTIALSNFTLSWAIPFTQMLVGTTSMNYEFADELIEGFGPPVWNNLHARLFDPNYVCSEIAICDDLYYQRSSAAEFESHLTSQTPPVDRNYPEERVDEPLRMFQISDAHVDR